MAWSLVHGCLMLSLFLGSHSLILRCLCKGLEGSELFAAGAVLAEPRYGFVLFAGSHLGPDGVDRQAHSLP